MSFCLVSAMIASVLELTKRMSGACMTGGSESRDILDNGKVVSLSGLTSLSVHFHFDLFR